MNTWLYSVMRNEEMMLPYFLRHYQNLADKIIIYNHASTDATARIAAAHPSAEVRPFALYDLVDEPTLTQFANTQYKEARGAADWVMWVDADEFLYHPHMLAYLAEMQAQDVRVIRTQGYTMLDDCPPYGDAPLISQVRRGVPDPTFSKWAIFNPSVEMNFQHGRHHANPTGFVSPTAEVKLLHYRYFGADWLRRKNETQWAQMGPRNKLNGWGYHYGPDNHGYYSPEWFAKALTAAQEVI
jgi:glycosyltransferase involved in cell wall biosynthesis